MNKSACDFDQEIARACARLRELADGNLAPSTRTYNAQRGDCRTSDYFNQHGYPYSALVALAGLAVCVPGRCRPGVSAARETKVTPEVLERVRDLLRQLATDGRIPRQADYNAARAQDMPTANTLHAHGYTWLRMAQECGLQPSLQRGVAVDGVPPEVEAEIVAALQRGDHLPTWKIAWPLFSEKTPPRRPPPEEPAPTNNGDHRAQAYAIPGAPAPTRGRPASDDARAAMPRKVAARLRQMAAPHESAGELVAPTSEEYDHRRGPDTPSSATLRAAYRIQWRDLCAAAGLRIRRGNGIAPDLTGLDAAPAIPDVRIVMDDAPGSALTGNVTSETPPPAVPPARSLAEIEADPEAWRLPRPQRDPFTGQLIPPRDADGRAVWRVRVFGADERTCAICGETFTPRIVRNSHGAPKEICYCERCGVEGKDGSGAPVAAPNVRTLAYLQDDEAEIVAMAPA